MKFYEEEIYFKNRDGTFYYAATKEEIYNILDIYDFDMIKNILECMDYPWFPEQWVDLVMTFGETPKNLARYISYCHLKAFLPLGYKDSKSAFKDVEKEMIEALRKRMDPDYYGS